MDSLDKLLYTLPPILVEEDVCDRDLSELEKIRGGFHRIRKFIRLKKYGPSEIEFAGNASVIMKSIRSNQRLHYHTSSKKLLVQQE